ncbi:MAG: hypothetical protein WCX32_00955 [Clostridia bacterium]|jgi:hypothetical protein|nr:hypothetical protein [Clostridia bacterium]
MFGFNITRNKIKQAAVEKIPNWIKLGGIGIHVREDDINLINDTKTNQDPKAIKRFDDFRSLSNSIHDLYMAKCNTTEKELEQAKNTGTGIITAQKKCEIIYNEFNKIYGVFSNYSALSTTTYDYDEKIKNYATKITEALNTNKSIKTLDFYNEFCAVADDIHITYAFMYIIQSMKLFYENNIKSIKKNTNFSSLQKEQEENRELGNYRKALRAAEQNYYDIILDLKLAINKGAPILNAESGDSLLKKVGFKFSFKEDTKSEISDMQEYMDYVITYDTGIKQFTHLKKIVDSNVKQDLENLK